MKIIRARSMGWCFGVRDAVRLVRREADAGPVTVLGELVHNPIVNAELERRGVKFTSHLDQVHTDTAIVTAHGASESALRRARERVPHLIEATCPLVHSAHRALAELVRAGYHPVVVGQSGHVEVRGLTEDLAECDVVWTEGDVHRLRESARFGVVAQTTQPIRHVEMMVACLRARFPGSEVRFVDTVCQPTKQRQEAAIEMARQCDIVVVIGGRHSNNTRQLALTCLDHCARVRQVENASELDPSWFNDVRTVGLTAGTSTPDETIDEVEHWLRCLAQERNVTPESVLVSLPDEHPSSLIPTTFTHPK